MQIKLEGIHEHAALQRGANQRCELPEMEAGRLEALNDYVARWKVEIGFDNPMTADDALLDHPSMVRDGVGWDAPSGV